MANITAGTYHILKYLYRIEHTIDIEINIEQIVYSVVKKWRKYFLGHVFAWECFDLNPTTCITALWTKSLTAKYILELCGLLGNVSDIIFNSS